jgi:hypothetical protein
VEHWHKGKVDEWNVFRMQAYVISLSSGNYKNPPTPAEMFPLPYDDYEIAMDWDIAEFYNNAIK